MFILLFADAMIVVHILTSMISVSFAVTILIMPYAGCTVDVKCCFQMCLSHSLRHFRTSKIATAGGGVHFLQRG